MAADEGVSPPARGLSPQEVIAELDRDAALSAALPPTDALFPGESDPPLVPEEVCVGVVLASWAQPSNPYWQPLMLAVRDRLLASSCSLVTQGLYASTDRTDPLRQSFADRAIEAGVDGVIVASLSSGDSEVAGLAAAGIPTLFVDARGGPDSGWVTSDNRAGMAAAIEHLVEGGRRRIAHVSGPLRSDPAVERLAGFRSAVVRAGLALPPAYVESGDWASRSGYEAAQRLLALDPPPDAITAASDFQALGVLAALADAGLRVPDDIAVTGFDGMAFTLRVEPQLTTLVQDAQRLGRTAAEGLLQMIEQPANPPFTALVPVELVVRASSEQPHGRR